MKSTFAIISLLGLVLLIHLPPAVADSPVAAFVPDEFTLLLAHFDQRLHADHALGSAAARGRGRHVAAGRFGGGLQVPGGAVVDFAGKGNFPRQSGTIEFWLKPGWDGNDGVARYVLGSAASEANYLNINKLPTGRFGAGISSRPTTGDQVYRRADASVADWKTDQWHHVAICWHDGQLTLWLDGREAAKQSGALAPEGEPETIRLQGPATFDELRISSVPRYGLQAVTEAKPVAPQARLHPNWKFNEPPGIYRLSPEVQASIRDDLQLIPTNYLDDVDPQKLPPRVARPELRMFASPDESEPATFLLIAGTPLRSLRVAPGDLRCGDKVFAADRVQVRRVVRTPMRRIYTEQSDHCDIVGRFLPRWQTADVPAGEFREVWLSLDVPADCPPGEYRGCVRLIHADGTHDLPLVLEILPIHLVEHPQKQLACYYQMKDMLDRAEVLRELADLRGHGVCHLVTSLTVEFRENTEGRHADFDNLRAGLDLIREAGFKKATIVVGSGMPRLAALFGHSGKNGRDDESLTADAEFMKSARAAMEAFVKFAAGYPEFRLMLTHLDEVFNEGRLPRYIALSKAVRQVPAARLYITFHTRDENADAMRAQIAPFADLRCHHGYTFEWWLARGHTMAEYERELKADGDEAWFYHNPRGTFHTPLWSRIINGVYLWASPFRAHCPWTYQSFFENPFDDTDGPPKRGHDFLMSAADPENPEERVPTRWWEAMREGADDLRYFATLEDVIAKARSRRPGEAAAAEQFLNRLKRLVRDARPAASSLPSRSENSTVQIDLDTGLQMGSGVVGSAGEAPLIQALASRFPGDAWQQVRRQAADWILKLQH